MAQDDDEGHDDYENSGELEEEDDDNDDNVHQQAVTPAPVSPDNSSSVEAASKGMEKAFSFLSGPAVQALLLLLEPGSSGFSLAQLGLDARLEAGLCFAHKLRTDIVPRAEVGGGDRHGDVREVADLDLRLDLRLDL